MMKKRERILLTALGITLVACIAGYLFWYMPSQKTNIFDHSSISIQESGQDETVAKVMNRNAVYEISLRGEFEGDPFALYIGQSDSDLVQIRDYDTEMASLDLSSFELDVEQQIFLGIQLQGETDMVLMRFYLSLGSGSSVLDDGYKSLFLDEAGVYAKHVSVLLSLLAISFALAMPLRKRLPLGAALAVCPLLTVGLVIGLSLVLLILGVYKGVILFPLLGLACLAAIVLGAKQHVKFNRKERIIMGVVAVAAIILCVLLPLVNMTIASNDSAKYYSYTINMVQYGALQKSFEIWIYSLGVGVPILEAFGMLLGLDYFYSLFPLMSFCLVTLLGYAVWSVAQGNRRRRVFAVSMLAIALLSCYFYVFQSVWYMSNMLCNWSFAGFAVCSMLYQKQKKEIWFSLAVVANFVYSFSRIETMLLGFVSLFYLCTLNPKQWTREAVVGVHVLVVCGWLLKIQLLLGSYESAFLTSARGWLIIGAGVAFFIFMFLQRYVSFLGKFLSAPLMYGLLTCVCVVVGVMNTQQFMANFDSITHNMFTPKGFWGVTWILVVFGYIVTWGKQYGGRSILLQTVVLNAMTLFIMMSVRVVPMRYGFGDSGNRLMMAILPLLVMDIVLRFICVHNESTTAPRTALQS